jgi:hypothetical protein
MTVVTLSRKMSAVAAVLAAVAVTTALLAPGAGAATSAQSSYGPAQPDLAGGFYFLPGPVLAGLGQCGSFSRLLPAQALREPVQETNGVIDQFRFPVAETASLVSDFLFFAENCPHQVNE